MFSQYLANTFLILASSQTFKIKSNTNGGSWASWKAWIIIGYATPTCTCFGSALKGRSKSTNG